MLAVLLEKDSVELNANAHNGTVHEYHARGSDRQTDRQMLPPLEQPDVFLYSDKYFKFKITDPIFSFFFTEQQFLIQIESSGSTGIPLLSWPIYDCLCYHISRGRNTIDTCCILQWTCYGISTELVISYHAGK